MAGDASVGATALAGMGAFGPFETAWCPPSAGAPPLPPHPRPRPRCGPPLGGIGGPFGPLGPLGPIGPDIPCIFGIIPPCIIDIIFCSRWFCAIKASASAPWFTLDGSIPIMPMGPGIGPIGPMNPPGPIIIFGGGPFIGPLGPRLFEPLAKPPIRSRRDRGRSLLSPLPLSFPPSSLIIARGPLGRSFRRGILFGPPCGEGDRIDAVRFCAPETA